MYPLSVTDRNVIVRGEWLDGDHMNRFIELLNSRYHYRMQGTWKTQHPHLISEEPLNQEYIQILHSCDNFITNENGHWICLYYDTDSILIYDSLQMNRLHNHHKLYINRLFPTYPFDKKPIKFVQLKQRQPNGSDCGVFAIAYATSLFFGSKPETVTYNHQSMRPHLIKMFETNSITLFPLKAVDEDSEKLSKQRQRSSQKEQQVNSQLESTQNAHLKNETARIRKPNKTVLVNAVDAAHKPKSCTENHKKNNQFRDAISITEGSSDMGHNTIKAGLKTVSPKRKSNANVVNNKNIVGKMCKKLVVVTKDEKGMIKLLPIKSSIDVEQKVPFEIQTEIQSKNNEKSLDCNIIMKDNKPEFDRAADKEKNVSIDNTKQIIKNIKEGEITSTTRSKKLKTNKIIGISDNAISNLSLKRKRSRSPVSNKGDSLFQNNVQLNTFIKTEHLAKKKKKKADNPENKRAKEQTKYNGLSDAQRAAIKKAKNRRYYLKNKQSILAQQKMYRAKKLSRKYCRISINADRIKTLHTKERYIIRIAYVLRKKYSTGKSRLKAEKIIKWCFHIRDKRIFEMGKMLKHMREKTEVSLTLLTSLNRDNIEDKIVALCGSVKKHTVSTESYFSETTYVQPFHTLQSIVMNMAGKAVNILPLRITQKRKRTSISWDCSPFCRVPDIVTIDKYIQFLQAMNECSMRNVKTVYPEINECTTKHSYSKLGHSQACYVTPTECNSLFISVEILSPHFPQVRGIKRLYYQILELWKKIHTIDVALNVTDILALEKFAAQAIENATMFKSTNEILLDEDAIIREHFEAFKALKKRSMDMPRLVCVSCEKLYSWKDVSKIKNLRSQPTVKIWRDLMKHIQDEGKDCDYVCHYCLEKFRSGNVPPTCILNNLIVQTVPDVITQLNDYERILIQRAKAFQTVVKMGTVAKKNVPHSAMVSKVQGRTFHLPLPLENTLERICSDTDPINREHELYILVRGIPTKAKKFWETLVDVTKVFNALFWLKDNNPLYSEIKLPVSPINLLDIELADVEFVIPEDDALNDDDDGSSVEKVIGETVKDAEKNLKKEALLTQMSQSDSYYEQFSIHPMYSDKVNKTSTELYQMLKIQNLPLDNRDASLDLKCFPDLYPYGVDGQCEKRTAHLTTFEYIKTRLMSKYSQYRLNLQYLFYLLHNHNLRQLSSGIYHKMNVTDARVRYTAADYLEQLAKGELEGNLNTIFSKLRNTEQFWRKPRNDLNCMIRYYGPPTWFLTLSPAEWCWAHLTEYLRELNPHLVKKSGNELVVADPVSTSRIIENEFRAILAFLCSKSNPIGEVIHYFWRREYQGRGTQHFHMLIWIKDAPVLGISSKEEVVDFLKNYVTCRIPNKNISPTLHRRVTTHQKHHHNSYCMRSKMVGSKDKADNVNRGSHKKVCRFSFPKTITDEWIIRDVETSIAGRRQLKSKCQLYDNPRRSEESYINNYNPAVLTAWEGNMDISFVGEKSCSLAWYITKYIVKKEKTHVGELFDQINSTKSLHSRLWNIGLRGLNNRECGALEAADTLLGNSLYGTDSETTIRWVDVNLIRNRKLKPRQTIESMDTESTDIFYPGLVDHHYPKRPSVLDKLNLHDFAMWYDVVKGMPKGKNVEYYKLDNGLYLKKRSRGYLINHYTYDVKTQPEKYFHSLLLLFQHWRDVDELKNGYDTYTESFLSVQSHLSIAVQYHERLTEIKNNWDEIKELIAKREKDMEQEKDSNSQADEVILGGIEAGEAMKDFKEIGDKQQQINVAEMIKELNSDQKRVFDSVTNAINSQQILRLYVSGEGGTGKSFLIKTITCWLKQIVNKDTAVTAPTGIAAFNIDGLTVHRLLQLPVQHGQTPKYRELSDAALKTIRDNMKNVDLIIIDEVSMISNVTLLYIHLRLTEIFNTANIDDGWFGKKHILLFGDLFQLPPVSEEPAFMKLTRPTVEKLLGCLGSTDLWCNLFTYDELTINMRQKNDSSYREMLSRLRLGFVNAADSKTLQSRKIPFASTDCSARIGELCDYMNKLPSDTVCLLPTCYMCDVLNDAMLSQVPSHEIKLIAYDSLDCPPSLKKKTIKILDKDEENVTRTAGLARVITIKVGAKVMLRRNIDVTIGLVNGTIGTIVSVSRALDNSGVDKVKIILPTGIAHDIERVSVKFQVMDGAFVIRKQFPLCLSYGITIHKSQGLSLENAVIDAGNSIFSCGQVYVALSRVTRLKGLHLINYDPHSVRANPLCVVEYNRLRELYRPDLAKILISYERASKVADSPWAVPKNIIDCQAHHESDHCKKTDINGFRNIDGVSCYANATIQCVFHCKPVRNSIVNSVNQENPLAILLRTYMATINCNNLTTISIRQHVGKPFNENHQQDVPEFFKALCDKFDCVKRIVEHKSVTKTRCQSCNYVTTSEQESNYILLLGVTHFKQNSCLQEIIDHDLSSWKNIHEPCNNCTATNKYIQRSIAVAEQVLVIQIPLTTIDEKTKKVIKTSFNIKAIPSSKVIICGNTYKVTSGIFHHGHQNIRGGHYTCMLRCGPSAWTHVHDLIIEKQPWPRNAKDSYMLFLERAQKKK